MFGSRHTPRQAHVELAVPPALYESLSREGVDISEFVPSVLAAILSVAIGAGRGNIGNVEISFSP